MTKTIKKPSPLRSLAQMVSDNDSLIVSKESPQNQECLDLLGQLRTELSEKYPDELRGVPLVPEELTAEGAAFLVAKCADQPVGCGAIRPFEPAWRRSNGCSSFAKREVVEWVGRYSRVLKPSQRKLATDQSGSKLASNNPRQLAFTNLPAIIAHPATARTARIQ